jgi:polar amino acid transport system substrate-binding protein
MGKRRKWRVLLSLLALLLAGCNALSGGAPLPAPTQAAPTQGTVIRLVTGEYAPFTGENLPQGGMGTEIVTSVLKSLDWQYQIVFEPWERSVVDLDANQFFGAFPFSIDVERSRDHLFSDAIFTDPFMFFALKDAPFHYLQPDDLTGRTLCYPGAKGWSLEGLQPLVDAGKIKMERPADLPACFNMLKANRVDLVFAAESVGWTAAKTALGSTDAIKTLEQPYKVAYAHIMITKTYPNGSQLLGRFNAALQKLEEDGTLAEIRSRHLAH